MSHDFCRELHVHGPCTHNGTVDSQGKSKQVEYVFFFLIPLEKIVRVII